MRQGIEIATGGNILAALTAYEELPETGGATYDHEIPDNPVSDWLIEEHMARFGTPPDPFGAGGMAAGIAMVEVIERAGSSETENLIATIEEMEWEAPMGTMRFRPEDHPTLQAMYHFRTEVQEGRDYGVPALARDLGTHDLEIPISNRAPGTGAPPAPALRVLAPRNGRDARGAPRDR